MKQSGIAISTALCLVLFGVAKGTGSWSLGIAAAAATFLIMPFPWDLWHWPHREEERKP